MPLERPASLSTILGIQHLHAADYLNDYIRLADTKAAAVFVVASGMISIVVSTAPH